MKVLSMKTDDMLNGEGLRVVIWVSGCEHKCEGCFNPESWDCNIGEEFKGKHLGFIADELSKSYISGITLTGGDPLHPSNFERTKDIINWVHLYYPTKNIWIYTGYETVVGLKFKPGDVLVTGKFEEDKKDSSYHWAGSTNQKIIRF